MALIRWDPFRDMVSLQERMNRLFEDVLSKPRGSDEGFASGIWAPPVDIYENEQEVLIKAEVPGMNQTDISVEVKDGTLVIKGERKHEKDVKDGYYHRVERVYGTFQRSFTLPTTVEADKVTARYRDGVLELKLPKAESAKPKQIKVEVQ